MDIDVEKFKKQLSDMIGEIVRSLDNLFSLSETLPKSDFIVDFLRLRITNELETLQKDRPVHSDLVEKIVNEVLKAIIEKINGKPQSNMKVTRLSDTDNFAIDIKGVKIGGNEIVLIGGPCSIEHYEQIYFTAKKMKEIGVTVLRGGAFKPRTSPYSFQGLKEKGLKMIRLVADKLNMIVISEITDIRDIPLFEKYVEILQVGTKNMFNYSLLKELGKINRPVMIKRGFMSTIKEFILAAEYVCLGGNNQIILCERGIRTFETSTRNTLDISAIPILKKETYLPVIVDISHSIGRKDIVKPIACAALSAGADGLMFESHYEPSLSFSDATQQLDLKEAQELIEYLVEYFGSNKFCKTVLHSPE